MPEIILHHYPTSVFSERVRLGLGLKGLSWRSVIIPGMMPKPDLLPLTGGYRRTPVMQIGADVFCDTAVILRRIEALRPEPSLFPGGSEGVATALAWWADKAVWWPLLGVLADTISEKIPADFAAERKAFGFPLAKEDVRPLIHRHLAQGAAHLGTLASMLSDGRSFLLGDAPSLADLAAYSFLWVLKDQGGAEAEARLPLQPLRAWAGRVEAIGHGFPSPMSAEEALAVALNAEPETPDLPANGDPSGLAAGQDVIVTPDDTGRDPVRGTLVAADMQELIIRSSHPRVGAVNIHFPRSGFDAVAA